MTASRIAAVFVLTALAAACGGDPADLDVASAWDSAGVRIVENGEIPVAGWRVEREPLFTVGWEEDDPTFTWLQSGRILPDGGALVGDFGEGAVYRIGSDGSVLQSWGRKGEGPGEFQGLDAMVLHADSVLISDGRLGRVTFLSLDGGVRTVRLPDGPRHQISAVMADGRLLLVPSDAYGQVFDIRPEWVFETQPILAAGPGGSSVDTLVDLPHLRRWYGDPGGSPGPIQVKGRASGFTDGFAWARSDEREVRWYDESGRLVQIARWDEEPVPVTSELRSHLLRTLEETYRSISPDEAFISAQLGAMEEQLDRHEGPLPYWDSFHVDRLGNTWLGPYPVPGEPPSAEWRVVDRNGTLVGWVDVPGILAVLDITDDRILAVRRDELDVPALVMLDLDSTGGRE